MYWNVPIRRSLKHVQQHTDRIIASNYSYSIDDQDPTHDSVDKANKETLGGQARLDVESKVAETLKVELIMTILARSFDKMVGTEYG